MITSCAPSPPMRSYIPSPVRTASSSTRRAGNGLGTTLRDQSPSSPWDSSARGVAASLPGQSGHVSRMGSTSSTDSS